MGNSHYCVERFMEPAVRVKVKAVVPLASQTYICKPTAVPAVRVHQKVIHKKGKVGWLLEGSSPFHFTTCSSSEPSVP
jgi:hypothetical protein